MTTKNDFSDSNKIKKQKFDKLSIPTMEGFNLIDMDRIIYLQSDNAYTHLFLDTEKIISTKNLGFYELELAEEPFLRIHNSYMVNMRKVIKYIKGDDGFVVLENKKIIKVSRSRKDELFDFFTLKRNYLPASY